jgi:hypothetical protein
VYWAWARQGAYGFCAAHVCPEAVLLGPSVWTADDILPGKVLIVFEQHISGSVWALHTIATHVQKKLLHWRLCVVCWIGYLAGVNILTFGLESSHG